jgi:2-oxoglutarate dehydrogenase E2 component (dihydrolipoamide succinyltransferase)
MARFELVMPKMGESITEATVLKWLKKDGDLVAKDEAVLEIATDKVDSEVPTPEGGTLVQLLHAEGSVVKVGAVLAVLETLEQGVAQFSPASPPLSSDAGKVIPPSNPVQPRQSGRFSDGDEKFSANMDQVHRVLNPIGSATLLSTAAGATGRFYSPLVLNIARQENISMSELERIPGTGDGGRLTKKDLLSYMAAGRPAILSNIASTNHVSVGHGASAPETPNVPTAAGSSANTVEAVTVVEPSSIAPEEPLFGPHGLIRTDSVEIIEMDRMRKLIADNMVASKHTSAHVTSFVEADVTNLHFWREEHKAEFEKRFGEKLTFTPMFVEAVVKAIQDFPMINVSVDGSRILKHKEIHVGMAAALPDGNLIVPVIHHADQLNLVGITKRVNDLANRARMGKLRPEEIHGGTFTLSNVGTFGNVMGTPIIAQPQVAILAVGAIRKRPAVIETPKGDFIGIRYMMFLSHSYDHRVVDGALGGMFVKRVAEYLEGWDSARGI